MKDGPTYVWTIAPLTPYRKEMWHKWCERKDMNIPWKALPSAITVSDRRFTRSLQTHEDRPGMSMSLEEKRKVLRSYHVRRSNLCGSLIFVDQIGPKALDCKRTELEVWNEIIIDWEFFQGWYPKLDQTLAHSPVCVINTRWMVSKTTVIPTYPTVKNQLDKATDSKSPAHQRLEKQWILPVPCSTQSEHASMMIGSKWIPTHKI